MDRCLVPKAKTLARASETVDMAGWGGMQILISKWEKKLENQVNKHLIRHLQNLTRPLFNSSSIQLVGNDI